MILRPGLIILIFLLGFHRPHPVLAEYPELSGRIRSQSFLSLRDGEDILTINNHGDSFFADAALDGRINLDYQPSDNVVIHSAYEVVFSGGMSRRAAGKSSLEDYAGFRSGASFPDDETQLFSLSDTITEKNDHIMYHRLDRLYLELRTRTGDITLGRQALTWGNGMIYNPVDLVNPFAPSDVIRDYKLGSDMIHYRYSGKALSDLQLAYVPRREQEDGDLSFEASTLGSKLSFAPAFGDLDIYALYHYQDTVTGVGVNIFLKDALFRSDLILTVPESGSSALSAVANIDYSWVWLQHNWYGMLEAYYNGFGETSVLDSLQNPELTNRIERGDLFALGKHYLNGLLRYEAHPLINLHTSFILNLDDGSFYLQPRIDWSLTSSTELLAGINIAVGGKNTEFGLIEIPESDISAGAPSQFYLILTHYF